VPEDKVWIKNEESAKKSGYIFKGIFCILRPQKKQKTEDIKSQHNLTCLAIGELIRYPSPPPTRSSKSSDPKGKKHILGY